MNKIASRKISLDILKIIAICLVIYNHTGQNGYELFRYGSTDFEKGLAAFLDTICKAGVSLFFMVSGALLLGKDEPLKDVLLKRVLRFAVILMLFSFIYYIRFYILHPEYGFSLTYFVTYIYSHPFITPFWFLYIYLPFLCMLPFLRAIVKNLSSSGYIYLFIILLFFSYISVFEKIFHLELLNMSLGIIQINIAYPLLGYGIVNSLEDKYFNKKWLMSGIIIFFINNLFAALMTLNDIRVTGNIERDYMSVLSVFPTIFIFYVFIYMERHLKYANIPEKLKKAVSYVGSCTLCIFLFEEMLRIDIFMKMFEMTDSEILKWVMCIPYTICIVLSGALIALIIRRIPVINRLKL